MGDNIQYINEKEKEVLKEVIDTAMKHIKECQIECQNTGEMLTWARFQEKKTILEGFLAKINRED